MPLDNLIVRILPAPAVTRVLVEIAVKLQYHSGRERDVGVIGVNRVQDVTVAGDFTEEPGLLIFRQLGFPIGNKYQRQDGDRDLIPEREYSP